MIVMTKYLDEKCRIPLAFEVVFSCCSPFLELTGFFKCSFPTGRGGKECEFPNYTGQLLPYSKWRHCIRAPQMSSTKC